MEKKEFGNSGESLAVDFLKEKGLDILETNWRFGKNEIDIIAANDNEIIFVEVKTRSSNYFGEPETFVNQAKQRTLIKGASYYVSRFNIDKEIRFDVVSIILNTSNKKVNHIEYAFQPRW
jgi:putative endonuclease